MADEGCQLLEITFAKDKKFQAVIRNEITIKKRLTTFPVVSRPLLPYPLKLHPNRLYYPSETIVLILIKLDGDTDISIFKYFFSLNSNHLTAFNTSELAFFFR
jgi:hypothetical protein